MKKRLFLIAILCVGLGGIVFFALANLDSKRTVQKLPTLLDDLPASPFEFEQKVPKDLFAWIEKTPLENPWTPKKDAKRGTLVLTNEDDVFLFLNGWQTEMEYLTDDAFVDQEHLVFKDPVYGDSIAMAAILKEPQEIFFSDHYSTIANPLMSGGGITNIQSISSDLFDLGINFKENGRKESVFWVSRRDAAGDMALLFNQNGSLLYAAAIGCEKEKIQPCLDQFKKIRKELGLTGLDDAEFSEQNVKQDFYTHDKTSALKTYPYINVPLGNKPKTYETHILGMGALNLPLLGEWKETELAEGAYEYSHEGTKGRSSLKIALQDSSLESVNDAEELKKKYPDYMLFEKSHNVLDDNPFVMVKENTIDGRVEGQAITTTENSKTIMFTYSFPADDTDVEMAIKKAIHFSHM